MAEDAPSVVMDRGPLRCGIAVEYGERVNFAVNQRGIPLVGSLRVTNESPAALVDVSVVVSLENGECEPWTGRVAMVEPGSSVTLKPRGFALSSGRLAGRTEAERTLIRVVVSAGGLESRVVFPLDVLPFDHWPGVEHLPELTAAFVTPNHPLIAEVLRSARPALRGLSGRDGFDEYQSGSRVRVSHQAEACFNALALRGLGYISPPASFETAGQRVRLVDRVLGEGMGTCLDLALLLVGAWEQCGLDTAVLLPQGHALAGFWTRESALAEPVLEDAASVRNLIELGDLVAVEAVALTERGADFSRAVSLAREVLSSAGAGFCGVDVRSARKRGVRPLPLRAEGAGGIDPSGISELRAAPVGMTPEPVALAERAWEGVVGSVADSRDDGPARIRRWRTRLLDLSLHNRLINFRESGRTIGLRAPDLDRFENVLWSEERLTILPATDGDDAFAAAELDAGRVYSRLSAAESSARLLAIYRVARASIEETGANLLHVAVGMLRWYESDASETSRLAPLILMPARLVRTAAGSGYEYGLELSDEPTRPNITLLEKLRSEFGVDVGGLDALPEGESGLDLPLILRNFREAIRGFPRWEVVETAQLGLFSFNKFLMWRDLGENLDRLRRNRLVNHLVDDPGAVFDDRPFGKPEELDDAVGPGELLCTRDADSSQLVAVRAASGLRTFVLEGPPGTGKSQTITNIVSDAVARGRRVLFVAEKMAALSVVRRRLEQDGLGAWCLELHSAKASKKEVLAQLESALSASVAAEPVGWAEACASLGASRASLNGYVRDLHAVRGSGESVYQAIGRLSLLEGAPRVDAPATSPAEVTAQVLRMWRERVAALAERAGAIAVPGAHALRGIGLSSWRFGLREEVERTIRAAQDQLAALSAVASRALAGVGASADARGLSAAGLAGLVSALDLLRVAPGVSSGLLVGPDAAALRAQVHGAAAVGSARDAERAELLSRYRPEFLRADHLAMLDAAHRARRHPWPIRLVTGLLARRRARVYASGELPGLAGLIADLERAARVAEATRELGAMRDAALQLGARWNGGEADWGAVERLASWADGFASALGALDAGLASALVSQASDPAAAQRLGAGAEALVSAWSGWTAGWGEVERVCAAEAVALPGADAGGWLVEMAGVLERWLGGLGELDRWCAWRGARGEAAEAGLGDLAGRVESGEVPPERAGDAFERAYGEWWFNATANGIASLRGFNAEAHAGLIARFREQDRGVIGMARSVVASRVGRSVPAVPESGSSQSEVGILRRELAKKRRHMPTRRLIESMPTLLPRLKPCFLMSPLSVAQFLDASLPPFDLVVFDEASQIPVWDAIGAIARGNAVIVVGDSKQLPPTTFFQSLEGEDDGGGEPGVVEDVESILKECNAAGVPSIRLAWHYRSRHESLIAFSNHHYYQSELHTFPSPEDRSGRLGVTFRHVTGSTYDRGGTRTNRAEAEAVVGEVVALLTDPERTGSVGVVTFNLAQQTLIEDLLDASRRQRPELEPFFSSDAEEPVFVKNLESVQGDERDTIVFSVGYGPDGAGRVSMNFGPLNADGGERRLNVAVTRAKQRLIVFSSIMADQIDLRRTSAVGVRHFKAFLDFAARGAEALAVIGSDAGVAAEEDGLVRAVRTALEERGHAVDSRVGYGGYRIDLAVRDPERPGRYLLGIECDGASYRGASTARDRDRIRQSVLGGLGWRLARVWAASWRVNPVRSVEQLEIEIAAARARSSDGVLRAEPSPPVSSAVVVQAPAAVPLASEGAAVYVASKPPRRRRSALDLESPGASAFASGALRAIVETEGPIVRDLAVRRLASWCAAPRVTERFRAFSDEAEAACAGSVIAEQGVLWPAGAGPKGHVPLRVPGDDPDSRREIEHIPPAEVVGAVVLVLQRQFGLPREELVREAARLMGFSRVTPRVEEAIAPAVERSVGLGLASVSGDRISLAAQ